MLSLCFIPLIYTNKKRTKKGAEEFTKWKALKNFLRDFGKFNDKETKDIHLWEKYLVFATLFGYSKKIEKALTIEKIDIPTDYKKELFEFYDIIYIVN